MAELDANLSPRSSRSFQRILTDYEIAVTRIILFCVSELPFPMGGRKIISILKGSKSTFNIDHELNELETFSVLSPFSAKQLTEIIDILISTDLLKVESAVEYADIPVISMTEMGRDYLNGQVDSPVVILDSIIDKDVIKFDEAEKELFEQLRELRLRLALEHDVQPFTVCGDQVLRVICRSRPENSEELLAIKGVGEYLAGNYGDHFLEVINDQN